MKHFWIGFEKAAFNIGDARKAYKAVVAPRAVRGSVGIDTAKQTLDVTRRGKGKSHMPLGPVTAQRGMSDKAKNEIMGAARDAGYGGDKGMELPSLGKPGTIISKGMPQKSPMLNQMIPEMKTLSPENKEMLNRSVGMHEGFESTATRKAKGLQNYKTHSHPDVILRESNMVATMPKENEPVKNIYDKMRRADTTAQDLEAAIPGFQYGKTRLSRHGRRRANEILQRKGVTPMTEQDIVKQVQEAAGREKRLKEQAANAKVSVEDTGVKTPSQAEMNDPSFDIDKYIAQRTAENERQAIPRSFTQRAADVLQKIRGKINRGPASAGRMIRNPEGTLLSKTEGGLKTPQGEADLSSRPIVGQRAMAGQAPQAPLPSPALPARQAPAGGQQPGLLPSQQRVIPDRHPLAEQARVDNPKSSLSDLLNNSMENPLHRKRSGGEGNPMGGM